MIGMDIHANDLELLRRIIDRELLDVRSLAPVPCRECQARIVQDAKRREAQLQRIRSGIVNATVVGQVPS